MAPKLRRTAVALVAALVTVACGGTGEVADGDAVRFLVFGDPEELRGYRDAIAAFHEREPEVRVQLVEASDRDDLIARLSTSIAGGSPPDLFLINYRFFGQFAAKDALAPAGPRLDASGSLDEEDFYEEPMEAFRWENELMCLPQNVSSLVVYFNRDMFEAGGVPLPEPGWTWEEFVDAAAALTVDDNGDGTAEVHGVGIEPSIIRVAPFVWSNGGDLVDDEERPTRLALDSPEAKEALQRLFDLGRIGVMPSEEEREAEDEETRFLNGRLGMVLSSRRSTPNFRSITAFEWDVAPLPVMGEPAGILHSDAYCMTAASGRKDDAWRFVEFALGAEGQRIVAASGRTVPSLREVAESEAFLDPSVPPASSRVFLDTIPYIRRVPNISTWPEIEDAAEGIIELGLLEGHSVDRVVSQLIEVTRPMFARAER
ncbi:MAG TPA: sugar ABC transporter substrate-binding protein [Actinomycetota bacterium]|nr:sugar ABC transporter substrate-binding protein [Actinomycetota bacterium]